MELSDIVYDSGRLKEIKAFSSGENAFDGLFLVFETASCFFSVNDDTDEILWSNSVPKYYVQIPCHDYLVNFIGKSLQWAWKLENQQGYTDGIRLSFKDNSAFELIVIASDFRLCLITEV